VSLAGWKEGIRIGNLNEIFCPKNLGTWPVKFYAQIFSDALRPSLNLVRIDEDPFADFLAKEGAEDSSWTLRFWEIDPKKGWSRAITAGKDNPKVWREIIECVNGIEKGRAYNWAGVEFTHPKLQTRIMMHRWPVASIAPWGPSDSKYAEVKERFVNFLRRII
jgi:hypothetical protein